MEPKTLVLKLLNALQYSRVNDLELENWSKLVALVNPESDKGPIINVCNDRYVLMISTRVVCPAPWFIYNPLVAVTGPRTRFSLPISYSNSMGPIHVVKEKNSKGSF